MKQLLSLLIIVLLQVACSKDIEQVDPLSKVEKQMLESQIGVLDKVKLSDTLYSNLKALSKQSDKISNAELIKTLEFYRKSYDLFENNLESLPILFDFILYDNRCKGEISSLSGVLLWDVADKNFAAVTEVLRTENILSNVELIKSLLEYIDNQKN